MATLLLTAVGSAIAGPIGAAIGAMAGQRVDQALLGPKGRQGARLADLAVQSSSYGTGIPRLYGRMRVSGTVIWATDLREERRKVSQGKGGPKATVYSYSASFAVLLSGRPASRIGRIWADGKLLRGAAGDFKVETGFRFHAGAADQPIDPLIASAEGDAAPAYRGRAYAVFEDLALESFGNRIPMLSFEVIADEARISPEQVLDDLAKGEALALPSPVRLDGYVADGGSVLDAVAPLAALLPIGLRDDGRAVQLGLQTDAPATVPAEATGASPAGAALPPIEITRSPTDRLPTRAQIGFADLARDYQSGLQGIDLHLRGADLRVDLPAALDAEMARQLIADKLFRSRRDGQTAELRLPWRYLSLWQSASLRLDKRDWKVIGLRFEAMCLVLQLLPLSADKAPALPADAGRPTVEDDVPAGQTVLHVADLPSMGDTALTAPLVVAAAAGRTAGWRSAALLLRTDGQTDWQEAGGTAAPAVIGECLSPLPTASAYLFDHASRLTVRLLHEGMELRHADDAALDAGVNTALVGDEVLQFGRADRTGPSQWTLSRLLRGRRGTEAAVDGHRPGETFLLLDPDTLLQLPVPADARFVELLAKGVGDATGIPARCDVAARALRPLSPVHLRWDSITGGGIHIRWIRRSREGWAWLDGVDAPLSEESELYDLTLEGSAGPVRLSIELPEVQLSAELLDSFRTQGLSSLQLSIVQVGRFAVSLPLTGTIPL